MSTITGDIVMLAVPYPSLADVIAKRSGELAGKIVVDITNQLNVETFDSLVVDADGSAAAEVAAALPQSRVLKAFNTAGGLRAVDAGALSRARELKALGFLQLTLAAAEKISWTGGFGLVA